jgi:3-oxoacyl-[acyl-carrier protein] reductase
MYGLKGKVAIVTGASGGIGRAIAQRLAEEGAVVVVNYGKGADRAKEVVAAIESRGGKVKGPYFALQEAAKAIAEGGRIVNISSGGTHIGLPGATAYLGTKGALEQFTKGLAHELAPRGVTVNTVSPGFTDTPMLWESFRKAAVERTPLERLGTPQDIADVVAFVVSEQGRWLTGQTIQAGGGVVM